MKRILICSLFIAAYVSFTGCLDTEKKYKFTFKNESAQTITVTPDTGENWASFVLEPKAANSLTQDKNTVKFLYTPRTGITVTYPSTGVVLFSDSPAGTIDSPADADKVSSIFANDDGIE